MPVLLKESREMYQQMCGPCHRWIRSSGACKIDAINHEQQDLRFQQGKCLNARNGEFQIRVRQSKIWGWEVKPE